MKLAAAETQELGDRALEAQALENWAIEDQGYQVLRGVVAGAELEALREVFDRGVLASDQWPAPRGADWRHAQVDLHPLVQRVCRAPVLLDSAWRLLQAPFFLAQVEGREPHPQGGAQALHRDVETAQASAVSVLVYLDDFGPHNGATQVVPGTHIRPGEVGGEVGGEAGSEACTVTGKAGDVLVFDARLVHGATTNHAGVRRRSLFLLYVEAPQMEDYRRTAGLRGVRMATDEVFAFKTMAWRS